MDVVAKIKKILDQDNHHTSKDIKDIANPIGIHLTMIFNRPKSTKMTLWMVKWANFS